MGPESPGRGKPLAAELPERRAEDYIDLKLRTSGLARMSLHEALSANLARLCESKGSIAAVCRATQINRQQFNRYLSGETVPNKANREKICRYFGIRERELFLETATEAGSRPSEA